MKYVTKALLACALLLYAASVFLPWFWTGMIGGNTIYYWSFKAEIYPYPYPFFSPPYQVMFLDYWSSYGTGTILFVSQIFTLLFGLLTLLRKVEGKYGLVFLGLTLLFSTIPIGTCILTAYTTRTRMAIFLTGFWIASIALLLLIASLLTSLIRNIHPKN